VIPDAFGEAMNRLHARFKNVDELGLLDRHALVQEGREAVLRELVKLDPEDRARLLRGLEDLSPADAAYVQQLCDPS
jgi:hypothetical protein